LRPGKARARDRLPQFPRRELHLPRAARDGLQRPLRRGLLPVIAQVLEAVALWIQGVISAMGYGGVAGLMAIESACIPLPSEVIMPFAGSLVPSGRFTLWGAGLAGAIGCVIGSIPAYYAGAYGGRPLILRYGKYVLLSQEHL